MAAAVFADSLIRDWRSLDLGPADRAMLDYAVRLTTEPSSISAADVARLSDVGFDDRAIHDICAVTAYYAFVNRVADGLGVELEPRFE
ncbi:MAG: hypothetical protein Q8Q85_06465 [Gemmatimonadales bacterium]|nr:hypothetical protein [Gemmatimonadales bacterium]